MSDQELREKYPNICKLTEKINSFGWTRQQIDVFFEIAAYYRPTKLTEEDVA